MNLKRQLNFTIIASALVFALPSLTMAQNTPPEPPPSDGKELTLNFNNSDIRVLISSVSEMTGKNFIIDPRVKGKVTVISSKPMNKDELYEVFLSVLQVHGFAAVPGPSVDMTKIVPEVNAKSGPVTTLSNQKLPSDELVTHVIKIEHVAAPQLVPLLRPLIPQQGHLAAHPAANVLVITDRAANISRLIRIVRSIDREDSDHIEVIRLENASASEIVRIITALQQKDNKGAPVPGQPSLTADTRTNSILLTGDKSSRVRIRGIIAQLDTPLESGGNTKVFFLNYANAKDMVGILQGISTKTAASQQQQKGGERSRSRSNEIDIQADEANNAIVVTAPASVVRELESIIRQLDVPRAQVMIEAIIAEVSTDLTRELGAQLLVDGSEDGRGPIGGAIFSDAGNLASLAVPDAVPSLGDGLTMALGRIEDGSTKFALLLKALQGDAATNVLSTPSIVTLDNVEAEIVFAQNIPFLTGSYSNTGGGQNVGNPFQTVQRQDVGIQLKVKPHVNEGDKVKLEIEQEISSVEGSSASTIDITTNKRSIKTEVMADDGQIIVLGGLLQDRYIDSTKKIPLLGSIPVLGRLFSFNKSTKVKSNLMIFIRPIILHDNATSDYITGHKYKQIQSRQLEANIGKRGLIRDLGSRLPDIEVLFTPMKNLKRADNTNTTEAKNQQQ